MTDQELLATYKREGLLPALQSAAELLNSSDGIEKHGVQGWRELAMELLRSKGIQHGGQSGTEDEDSGFDHSVCAAVRFLMVVVLVGERR